MTWTELTVVAARAPDDFGIVVSQPVVSSRSGVSFLVRDVMVEEPVPNMALVLQDLLSGSEPRYVRVPEYPGRRGALTLIVSRSFAIEAGDVMLAGFDRLEGGLVGAYLDVSEVDRWRGVVSDRLVARANEKLHVYLRGGAVEDNSRAATQLDDLLRNCRYVTEPGSPVRAEVYAIWCALLRNSNPRKWKVVSDLIFRESGRTALDGIIERADGLLSASRRPGPLFGADMSESLRPRAFVRPFALSED